MITIKIRGEKHNKWAIIIPTVAIDWSEKAKNVFLAWLNGEICITVSKE